MGKQAYCCNIDSVVNAIPHYKMTDFDPYFTNIDLVLPLYKGNLLSLGDKHLNLTKQTLCFS